MRLSSHQFHLNSISNIQYNTARFNEASTQLATNQRITKPSDDPLGAVMLLNLDAELDSLEQYKSNMESVNFTLSQQEVKLTGIVNQIYSLQSLITTAADGSMGTEELKALGQEMSVIFPGIVDLLNGTDNEGKYYFSGSETNTKPFDLDAAGNYAYFGDDGVRDVAVTADSSVASNITGNELDPGANFLNAMKDYLVDVNNPPATGVGNESRVMIDELSSFLATITGEITQIGGTMASLDSLANSNLDIITVTSNLRDEISSVDYPEAFIKMNESMASYESSMQVYASVTSLSLFSFI
ncbi:flagellar hook-associated protein FlgL [Colwellia sp. 4_MG-2023]|jgi:flagellar hook-associated protein 3 FlgL|uniref:flagellar hook-associated protein FlgL n=1 Tax=unclassified Colwellia TaxID=196834 RepID=UPI001C08ACBF|nr:MULTISPECIES: flagellar hook-associated protein FlgL [unclassified Colwellia]MBU2925579.1 flagellar hook-associated protein FlgL [Colwellia sp. C2M11]MDO6486393.1 flagellar hook-associated protein FlgL [Colwellia sp. 6_MG-2023]MDO6505669.1 flagellar hook-associated protein FlgL [Colwellia sp. 5_MG-2023]MDO6554350.1 flagellar hook-associated protein FlgL [Colwellia sp. 4_MG-2023]MDO6654060.1 flagellar hook-associated protein FlgL [Colwellia sp. 3_MG-2023]